MYRTLIFDLDGTLINSEAGVTGGVAYALQKMGQPPLPHFILKKFIGPPMFDSFLEFAKLPEEKIPEAIATYREYYEAGGIMQYHLYDGICETMEQLHRMGIRLAIATAKPEPYAVKILKNTPFFPYLDHIFAASMDRSLTEKTAILQKAIDHIENQQIAMVGDRCFDLCAANHCGIDGIGVLYGFGSQEELEACNPAHLIHTPQELLPLCIN